MKNAMMRIILLLLFSLGPAVSGQALDITSVQPSTTSPGESVTLTGGPFSQRTLVMLGNSMLTPATLQNGRLSVRIPEGLAPGDYVIFVTEGNTTSQQAFILHLVEKRPLIKGISPAKIDNCQASDNGTELQITGSGFAKGARILLDGAAVTTERSESGSLSATLPPLAAGNHRIQVVNPAGDASIPFNITVSDQPTIDDISVGDDLVNAYQLIISGRNFSPRSKLLVNGKPISAYGRFHPRDKDNVEYIDCNTLRYTRYQVSGQLQRVRFRIQNPSGRQSNIYEATIR